MTIMSFCFGTITKFVFKRKLIYDIDDALFHDSSFEVSRLLRISDLVVVAGYGLYDHVKNYNKNVLIVPTSKRIQSIQNSTKQEPTRIALIFISGPRQLPYLQMLADTFIELSKHCDFELRVMSTLDPQDYKLDNRFFEKLRAQNVKVVPLIWSLETEKEELGRAEIGLAPLFGGIWEKYKCGFKIINYMSEGIPPVASAFGENVRIIRDGYNGYLCNSTKEWYEKLKRLIEDKRLRTQMGQNALATAQEKYSIDKNVRLLMNRLKQL
jgi:glycosyltransferase involved in cell wall biosynthesis